MLGTDRGTGGPEDSVCPRSLVRMGERVFAGHTWKPNWVTWSRKEMCTEAPAGASSELMGAAEADVRVSRRKAGKF